MTLLALSPTHRAAARVLLAAGALAAAAACTEVGTDPDAAVAIELDPAPLASLVVGDSLRDTLGRAVGLTARVLNYRNQPIAEAPVRFYALDTGVVALDSVTGAAVGRRTGQTTIVASIRGLQSERITLRVTTRPDTASGLDSLRRTMQLSLAGPDVGTPLRVLVQHDSTRSAAPDTLVPVPGYVVRFRIVAPAEHGMPDGSRPADTTRVVLVNDAARVSGADTTDAQGIASRQIRFSRAVSVFPDSVVVEAAVARPDATPVPGSPVRFIIRILRPLPGAP